MKLNDNMSFCQADKWSANLQVGFGPIWPQTVIFSPPPKLYQEPFKASRLLHSSEDCHNFSVLVSLSHWRVCVACVMRSPLCSGTLATYFPSRF